MRRKIQEVAKKIIKEAEQVDIEKDDLDVKNAAIQEFLNLKTTQKNEEKEMSDVMLETVQDIEKKYKKRDDYSYRTGYLDLDRIIEGLHEQELTIIAARPGVGKTSFALQMAEHIAKKNIYTYFVSLEMSEKQLGNRMIARKADIDSHVLRMGWLTEENFAEIGKAAGEISEFKMCIDSKVSTIQEIESKAMQLKNEKNLGLIVIDYLQLLKSKNKFSNREQEVADIKNMVIEKTDRMEKVLQQVVKVLASSTNYATLITGPEYHRNKVKFIQLSKVNEEQLLAVIVVEGNLVKNQMIDLDETINDEQILKLNLLLNTQLNGLTIEEINLGMIKKMKEQAGIHSGIISKVVDTVAEAIAVSEEDVPVYTSGATNIFKYPELSDSSKASQLISTFEERQKLVDMIKGAAEEQDGEENTGIQVYIGNESSMEPLRDCSVVTTTYDMGNGMRGTIGIVGPKRMDYENVVDNLKTLKVQLDAVFKKPDTGE